MKRMTRALGTAAASSALVLGGAVPAFAAPGGGSKLPPAPVGRTSTCPAEVSAEHPLCHVASFSTGVEEGRTIAFGELTTEAYNPDPRDRDHKTYVSDVLCAGPAKVRQRRHVVTVTASFEDCDVALGTASAGPYRWHSVIDTTASRAWTNVGGRTYGYSLFAAS